MALQNKKSLGQNWLKDRVMLEAIAEEAHLTRDDTVLEVGPGLGTLTSELLRRAGQVIAVEFDEELARKLPGQFPGKNLEVVSSDILTYDISLLVSGYKVVANVPYYITSKIIDKFVTAHNKPATMVLLVQKEVAERIAAGPGDMSLLTLSAQIYAEVRLGVAIPRAYFTPAPEVDSQVIVLEMRDAPLVDEGNQKLFWRLARAGFAARRKKLRSSLSAGLALSKTDTEELLRAADLDPNSRAQDLAITDWLRLVRAMQERA